MKKIGLITFCNHEIKVNYGQVLQAYALSKYLERMGYKVKIINYRAPYKEERGIWFNLFRKTFLYEELYKCVKNKGNYSIRNYKFYRFIKSKTKITRPCYCEKDVIKELSDCDILMAGSDQIWNIEHFDKIRLLDIGIDIHRVSYASSGVFLDTDEVQRVYFEMKESWQKIDKISVRELIGKKIIEKYTNKNVECVADPVLLLDRNHWEDIGKGKEGKYLFCYFLGDMRCYMHIIQYIKKTMNLENIICIDVGNNNVIMGKDVAIKKAGPEEFVGLLAGATYVCTDSYHGTLFSLIFEKQFCIMKRKQSYINSYSSIERWKILFEEFKLGTRWIANINEFEQLAEIDYEDINENMEKFRIKSKEYLKLAMER